MSTKKLPCDGCAHRRNAPGDMHSRCDAYGGRTASVYMMRCIGMHPENGPVLNPHGVKMGWCEWPINFDPIWIESCQLREEAGDAVHPDQGR